MNPEKLKVAIVGASGFTGSELARLLISHPEVTISMITSESHVGKPFSDLHPQFYSRLDIPLESADQVEKVDVDVIFLALPHGVSMDFVARWKDKGSKIIDLSGDLGSLPKRFMKNGMVRNIPIRMDLRPVFMVYQNYFPSKLGMLI